MNDHGVLLWQERLEREQRVGPSFRLPVSLAVVRALPVWPAAVQTRALPDHSINEAGAHSAQAGMGC